MSDLIPVEVPAVGESITEVQIGTWLKQIGDWVGEGEDLVEIETEKASMPIPSPAAGVLESIEVAAEQFASVGDVIAKLNANASAKPSGKSSGGAPQKQSEVTGGPPTSPQTTQEPTRDLDRRPKPSGGPKSSGGPKPSGGGSGFVMPAAKRLLQEHGLSSSDVPATGPGGRLTKEDVLAYVRGGGKPAAGTTPPAPSASQPPPPSAPTIPQAPPAATSGPPSVSTSLMTETSSYRSEEVKPLSMMRRTIAARLVQAQQTAALLTTFNEIDMSHVMSIRSKYKDAFGEKHGVKLGFMSFFAKAAVEALRRFPAVNAEIRGEQIVYHNYQDIGIAIGSGKGLIVPVLRNVERMSFADIEGQIGEFARLAGENRLQPADLMGGTFTISNGGVYGSLMSTPIVNPPQSGILGLHTIQKRPIADGDQVVVRPMMYIALTYDHRIVDGREAVQFLVTIKEGIEDPARLFLEV